MYRNFCTMFHIYNGNASEYVIQHKTALSWCMWIRFWFSLVPFHKQTWVLCLCPVRSCRWPHRLLNFCSENSWLTVCGSPCSTSTLTVPSGGQDAALASISLTKNIVQSDLERDVLHLFLRRPWHLGSLTEWQSGAITSFPWWLFIINHIPMVLCGCCQHFLPNCHSLNGPRCSKLLWDGHGSKDPPTLSRDTRPHSNCKERIWALSEGLPCARHALHGWIVLTRGVRPQADTGTNTSLVGWRESFKAIQWGQTMTK